MLAWLKKHVRPVLLVLAGLNLVPAYLHAYTLIGPTDIPTVLLGDKIIVNSAAYNLKLPYSKVTLFRSGLPKRGDFVLLRVPHNSRLINEKRAGARSPALQARPTRKIMIAGVPTGVYCPVNVRAPVFRFTRKQAMASLL